MAQVLTNTGNSRKGSNLTQVPSIPFRIAIEVDLEKDYCFQSLNKNKGYKNFQAFIDRTVGRSITEVEKAYKRQTDKQDTKTICNVKYQIIHFGLSDLRLHGYYNPDDYFVICRIDPSHEVHR